MEPKGKILTRRINLRGAQGRQCAHDPTGPVAMEFKDFAAREAVREGYRVELYIQADASGGIGHSSPWFWANSDGSRSDEGKTDAG
jgi:hypothetical protein